MLQAEAGFECRPGSGRSVAFDFHVVEEVEQHRKLGKCYCYKLCAALCFFSHLLLPIPTFFGLKMNEHEKPGCLMVFAKNLVSLEKPGVHFF